MATVTQPTRDRVGKTEFIDRLRLSAETVPMMRTPLAAVGTLDCHGRLACHWEVDVDGQFIQSG